MEAYDCNSPEPTGLYQLNGRAGHTEQGEYGAWRWLAQGGNRIVGATIKAKLRDAGGWSAQLYAVRPDGSSEVFGAAAGGDFDVYNLYPSRIGSEGATRLDAQLRCYRAGGCDLDALGGATSRPDNVQLSVEDRAPPGISASGALAQGAGWHRGTESVRLDAEDGGSGVSRFAIGVDNQPPTGLASVACPGDRGTYAVTLTPCPGEVSRSLAVSTSPILDGMHEVRFCAGDYGLPGPNYGCTEPRTIGVDNTAPLQPEGLTVAGGEDSWHADNSFDLSWSNPPQGASPIVAVHRRILDAAGSVAATDVRTTADLDGLDALRVPGGPGRYTVEVWLEDGAGNQGAPARAALRFDDVRPGRSDPAVGSGWIGRNEFPYTLRLGHPGGTAPLSGIRGYAVSIGQPDAPQPCAGPDRCSDGETDLRSGIAGDALQVLDLPEGSSEVRSVAVSGSGMRSAQAGVGTLRVDKTDPVSRLDGVPAGWSDQPVVLTAEATDSLSGMQPRGDDADPFTAILVDGGPPVASVGDSVSTAIAADGVHSASYYARDLAGNVDDGRTVGGHRNHAPRTATVRIDRTPPGIAFANGQDPNDPELVRAVVSDALSGPDPDSGRILVRRAGSADGFDPLPTEIVDGVMRARWDSDAYPAGEYEFRATGADRAGNAFTTSLRANGSEMVLPNPIKIPTSLNAGFGGRVLTVRKCRHRHGRRRCRRHRTRGFGQRPRVRSVSYGESTRFSGRLSAGLGSPLGQAPVRVVERFRPGSRRPRRTTTVRTGADGIFSVRLAPGPGRRVLAAFAGTRTLGAAQSRPARLRVSSGVELRASASRAVVGGRPVVFGGRVRGAGALFPPDGKLVQLQYRLPAVPWTEFRTLTTDARGRFRLGYRFKDPGSRGVSFQFRAFVPVQSLWPYGAGVSSPVVVRGR